MIAYEELERALARWRARRTGATPEAAETPSPSIVGSLPEPRERTGEIDMGDVVESYEEAP